MYVVFFIWRFYEENLPENLSSGDGEDVEVVAKTKALEDATDAEESSEVRWDVHDMLCICMLSWQRAVACLGVESFE